MTDIVVQIVAPSTTTETVDLLYAIANALEQDAARYKKANKVPDHHPGYMDRTLAASKIRQAAKDIADDSKLRWLDWNRS